MDKPGSIAVRALQFLEALAKRDCCCTGLVPGAVCDPCNARLIISREEGTASMKEQTSAECDIGNHHHCAGCDCSCHR